MPARLGRPRGRIVPRRPWVATATVATAADTGALAATTPMPSGGLTGDVVDSGALAGAVPAPSGGLAGTETATGALAGTTPMPSGALRTSSPGLTRWATALAGAATTPAVWLAIGDSVTEGADATTRANRWIEQGLAQIRAAVGVTGGRGSIPPHYDVGLGWATSGISDSGTDGNVGPFYRSTTVASGDAVTWTVTGTHARIWYQQASGAGTWSYSIDGGSATNVNASATPTAYVRTALIDLGGSGSHTVAVHYVSGASLTLAGLEVFDGDASTGVHLYDAALSGITTGTYVGSNYSLVPAAWQVIAPDLVTIFLGFNDAITGNYTPAQTRTNLETMVADLRALTVPPSIMVVVGYDLDPSAVGSASPWSDYATELLDLVTTDGNLALLDLHDLMPAADLSGTGLYSNDGVHPRDSGHTEIADLLAAAVAADTGALAGTTPMPTGALAGGVVDSGALAGAAPMASGTLTGTVQATGALAGTTPALSGALAGDVIDSGALAATTPMSVGALTTDSTDTGALAGATPALSGALAGDVIDSGALAGTTSMPSGALAGDVIDSGALAGSAPMPIGALTGTETQTGALAGVTPMPIGALTTDSTDTGVLAGAAPVPSGALSADVFYAATLAATTPMPTGAMGGDGISLGALAGAAPMPAGALAGTVTATGALAGGCPLPVGAFNRAPNVAWPLSPGEVVNGVVYRGGGVVDNRDLHVAGEPVSAR